MSAETLRNLETAVQAHYDDMLAQQPERQRGMIIDWVIGWTVHALVDVEGEAVSGYANWWAGADTNPNGQAHLAHWMGDEISTGIPSQDDEGD